MAWQRAIASRLPPVHTLLLLDHRLGIALRLLSVLSGGDVWCKGGRQAKPSAAPPYHWLGISLLHHHWLLHHHRLLHLMDG